ncbi:hypothetical protein [Ileibacterium valens]|uniref:hypothetical protein n=1 Tax=Ileibacterium valens TaxID=1862668 RepID=UPI0024BBD2BF|nr:hypothetical protein [Ileibacterium valens]
MVMARRSNSKNVKNSSATKKSISSQQGNKKSSKKKTTAKVHYGRLAVVILIPIALILGMIYGAISIYQAVIQHQRVAKIEEKANRIGEAQSEIAAASTTPNISPSTFAAYQELAKTQLGAFQNQVRSMIHEKLSDSDMEAVNSLSAPEDLYLNILKNLERYPEEYISFLNEDPRRLNFVSAFVNQEPYIAAPGALTMSLESLPALVQYDLQWAYQPFSGNVIGLVGSGPTALSAAASHLQNNSGITPYLAAQAIDSAGGADSQGVAEPQVLVSAGPSIGLSIEPIQVDSSLIASICEQQQIILGLVPSGNLSAKPQYILISYSDQPDCVNVYFPAFPADSKAYSVEEITPLLSEAYVLNNAYTIEQ